MLLPMPELPETRVMLRVRRPPPRSASGVDEHAALVDDHGVAALEVRRVAQLVHLDVALALEALLLGAQDDHAVDDGLLDAEAADLGRPVGDVRGEEADGLQVLDDAGELEDLLPRGLRVLDLVEENRERVDRDAASAPTDSATVESTYRCVIDHRERRAEHTGDKADAHNHGQIKNFSRGGKLLSRSGRALKMFLRCYVCAHGAALIAVVITQMSHKPSLSPIHHCHRAVIRSTATIAIKSVA